MDVLRFRIVSKKVFGLSMDKYIEKIFLKNTSFTITVMLWKFCMNLFLQEWSEVQDCLRQLKLSIEDILQDGGNESPIPKKFDDILYPYGWREIRISGDLIVKAIPYN